MMVKHSKKTPKFIDAKIRIVKFLFMTVAGKGIICQLWWMKTTFWRALRELVGTDCGLKTSILAKKLDAQKQQRKSIAKIRKRSIRESRKRTHERRHRVEDFEFLKILGSGKLQTLKIFFEI